MNKGLISELALSKTMPMILTKGRQAEPRSIFLVLGLLIIITFTLNGCASQPQRAVPPLMVSSIVRQSQEGVPADDIIRQIAESGTVYRLSASELANLRDQGVSDAVINYMQQTYLDAIRRDQSVADRNLWVYGPDGYYYGGYPFGWPYYYVPYIRNPEYIPRHAKNQEQKYSLERKSSPDRKDSLERKHSLERDESNERNKSPEQKPNKTLEGKPSQATKNPPRTNHHAKLSSDKHNSSQNTSKNQDWNNNDEQTNALGQDSRHKKINKRERYPDQNLELKTHPKSPSPQS